LKAFTVEKIPRASFSTVNAAFLLFFYFWAESFILTTVHSSFLQGLFESGAFEIAQLQMA
jgi:hypothetical protein